MRYGYKRSVLTSKNATLETFLVSLFSITLVHVSSCTQAELHQMHPFKRIRLGLKPIVLLYLLLFIYRLPSVSKLNGSVVTDGEREDSERFFIRYYVDVPQEEVPFR